MLVDLELNGSLTLLDLDGHDLLLEPARLYRRDRATMRLDREFVLRLAGYAVGLRQVLGRDSHVHLVERVRERADDRVHERRLAQPRAPARALHPVGAPAHRLGTAGERHLRVAGLDHLGSRDDRLQAAATQAVDRQRRRFLRNPGVDPHDARQIVVLGRGVDDVAEHNLLELCGVQPRALDCRAGGSCSELARWNVTQTAPEGADRGPGG